MDVEVVVDAEVVSECENRAEVEVDVASVEAE